MKLALYCTCGAAWHGTITPDAKADLFITEFNKLHFGEGHARCNAKTASRARAKEERQTAATAAEGK